MIMAKTPLPTPADTKDARARADGEAARRAFLASLDPRQRAALTFANEEVPMGD